MKNVVITTKDPDVTSTTNPDATTTIATTGEVTTTTSGTTPAPDCPDQIPADWESRS